MKILALSTSTPRGSAALLRDGAVAAESGYADLQGHAERVFAAIDAVLALAGETRASIEALAVDVGPGSFTGVRVGVASAKGIALGLGVPLAGVVSLEAMAAAAFGLGAASTGDVVLAAIDAKKSEVFVAAYDASGTTLVEPCARALGPEALTIVTLGSTMGLRPAKPGSAPYPAEGRRVIVVGEITAAITLPAGFEHARGAALDLPDAAWIGKLAAPRLAGGALGEVEPLYVRPPDITLPRREVG